MRFSDVFRGHMELNGLSDAFPEMFLKIFKDILRYQKKLSKKNSFEQSYRSVITQGDCF